VPEAVGRAADKGADCQYDLGKVGVHAPDLDRAVVVQADGIPRSSVQVALCRREQVTIHPCRIHRRIPRSVPLVLLVDQILHAGCVSAQGTDFLQVCVQAILTQHASVVDRPGGETARPSLVERAGVGEGHERRVKGRCEIVQVKKLLLLRTRSIERRLHVGPERARWQLEVQVRPGASARVQEPVVPDGAGLDPVARIVADLGSYREGIGAQGVQLKAKP
jgi:hypothetical protein